MVAGVEERAFARIASGDNVVEREGQINAQWATHEGKTGKYHLCASRIFKDI